MISGVRAGGGRRPPWSDLARFAPPAAAPCAGSANEPGTLFELLSLPILCGRRRTSPSARSAAWWVPSWAGARPRWSPPGSRSTGNVMVVLALVLARGSHVEEWSTRKASVGLMGRGPRRAPSTESAAVLGEAGRLGADRTAFPAWLDDLGPAAWSVGGRPCRRCWSARLVPPPPSTQVTRWPSAGCFHAGGAVERPAARWVTTDGRLVSTAVPLGSWPGLGAVTVPCDPGIRSRRTG